MATRNKSWKACGVFCFKNVIYYGGVLLSYTWGRTDKPMKIPIENERERQTYYGTLDPIFRISSYIFMYIYILKRLIRRIFVLELNMKQIYQ